MKPADITDLDLAFGPKNCAALMPPYAEIPEEFRDGSAKWNRFFAAMFYTGLKLISTKPKEGIDPAKAIRHLRAIAGSFEPKHEHKESSIAYLASQWFDEIQWDSNGKIEVARS